MSESTLSDATPAELVLTNDNEQEQEKHENEVESDPRLSLKEEDKNEFITVNLLEIRKDLQCPICQGIIRKTKVVTECMHRFCGECIDKSVRLSDNVCPACHTHYASPLSLKDDLNYDALISVIFPDIDKFEEELAMHEDEMTHNKKV